MKIAITGKGGVGKSFLTASLALLDAADGRKVLAIDADPDANLAGALGLDSETQSEIIPIAKQAQLIEERTGAKVGQFGQMFKLNPEVSDIADRFAVTHRGVALLVLGAADQGGAGCACPENVLLRSLVTEVVLRRDEMVYLDFEAGVEHLGRATASGVDTVIVVVEPGQGSIDCARRLRRMCTEIGITDLRYVANKVADPEDHQFLVSSLPNVAFSAVLPYQPAVRQADRHGISVVDTCGDDILTPLNELRQNLRAAL